MKIKLFHGTNNQNALSIIDNGFDFNKCGSNWGSTYGKGIYFTPNSKTAKAYSDDNTIIEITIDINPFYLTKDRSPNSKKKIKIPQNYNCIVSPNKDEYVLIEKFTPKSIRII